MKNNTKEKYRLGWISYLNLFPLKCEIQENFSKKITSKINEDKYIVKDEKNKNDILIKLHLA